MLEFLRKHTAIVMAAVALVFIGLVFLNDGKGKASAERGLPLFVIDGTTYAEMDYVDKYQRVIQIASRELPSITSQFFHVRNITGDPFFNYMAASILLEKEAERFGIYPDNEAINAIIKELPEFCNADGTFNPDAYAKLISYGGPNYRNANEKAIKQHVADFIRLKALEKILLTGVSVNENFSYDYAESILQTMEIQTAFLSEMDFRPATDPSEEQIREFWEKRSRNYLSDELRNITLYTFTPKKEIATDGLKRIAPATNEVVDVIETLWENLNKTNASDLTEKMDEVIKTNESLFSTEIKQFEAVPSVKKLSDGERLPQELKTELNPASGATAGSLYEIAFSLKPRVTAKITLNNAGETIPAGEALQANQEQEAKVTMDNVSTTLIQNDGKVSLIVVTKVIPAGPLPYELARASAKADLVSQMTRNALEQAANELRGKLQQEGTTSEQFKAIAEAAKARVQHWPSLKNGGQLDGMSKGPEIFNSLAKVNAGGVSTVITAPAEGAIIAQLIKRTISDSPATAQLITRGQLIEENDLKSAVLLEWYSSCLKRYSFQNLYKENNQSEN